MPRKRTGKPRGRPTGTGELGEQVRCTVRIPVKLYQRLEAYADDRQSTSWSFLPLSACVRELLDHALACPQRRQAEAQQREEHQRELQDLVARLRELEEQGRIASPH